MCRGPLLALRLLQAPMAGLSGAARQWDAFSCTTERLLRVVVSRQPCRYTDLSFHHHSLYHAYWMLG